MSRMLMTSSETLQSLKLSYKSQSSFTRTTMAQLARCAKLTSLELASSAEYIQNVPSQNIAFLKFFLKKKQASLKSLKLYDCDQEVLEALAEGPECRTLEELQIIKFNQALDVDSASSCQNLSELLPLSRL